MTPDKNDKQQKREAKQLRERADVAMQAGDYALVRALDAKTVEMAPEGDLAAQAQARLKNLRTDPWTLYGGLIAAGIYLVAWLYSLL